MEETETAAKSSLGALSSSAYTHQLDHAHMIYLVQKAKAQQAGIQKLMKELDVKTKKPISPNDYSSIKTDWVKTQIILHKAKRAKDQNKLVADRHSQLKEIIKQAGLFKD